MKLLINTFICIVFYSVFSFSAFAGISTAPAREAWALSTSDTISVNYLTKTANASVYLNAVDGTLYRATATTTGARLLGVAETALTGGKGNPWLTAAIAAAGLTYEGYQWYKNYDTEGFEYYGACAAYPSERITLSDCVSRASQYVSTMYNTNPITSAPIHYQVSSASNTKDSSCTSGKCSIVDGEAVSYSIIVNYQYPFFSIPDGINLVTDWRTNAMSFSFYVKEKRTTTKKEKEPISDELVQSELMSQLAGVSSRQAFSENSQPYPLDGLFTNEDLAVDPTYSPSADLNTETLPDYITKYNNGLLQTVDPSKSNYVTPAQYAYIKAQAEKAAAIAVNPNTNTSGATNTNPLLDMEQPITQAQYDESNKKALTEQATALNTAMNPLTNVLTQYNADKQFMIDKITSPTEPPAEMPNIFTWAWPTGSCQGFTLKFNIYVPLIGVLSMDKLVNEHCPPYDEWAHPALFWFFNIITGLYLFRLWDKTAAEVVRI